VIAALLLAAGAARRFGSDKLLQELHGKPLVRWSAEALAGAPVDEIIVVVPPEHAMIRRALAGLDVRFVVNPDPTRGMGSSIACGITAIRGKTDAALVALADEPLNGRLALDPVVDRYRQGGASIVVPLFNGVRGHPVLFASTVFEELRSLSGDEGARAVTDRDPHRLAKLHLNVGKPVDVDTPDDLRQLRATASEHPPLLHRWMPAYDVRASYAVDVQANEAAVYRAVLETNLADSIIARVLMAIRSLGHPSAVSSFRFGELPERGSFFVLADDPPREIVAGVIGRFWAMRGNVCEGDRHSFRDPLAPGTAKAAWNFRVDRTPVGCRLTTETRVLCADDESRRSFRRYWTVVGPFSGVIRREALRLIRDQAQYMSSPSSQLS
jgi:molybdenum cofactor cytidylyltransferase